MISYIRVVLLKQGQVLHYPFMVSFSLYHPQGMSKVWCYPSVSEFIFSINYYEMGVVGIQKEQCQGQKFLVLVFDNKYFKSSMNLIYFSHLSKLCAFNIKRLIHQ